MLPDRVSNPGPLTYESGALPIALRGPTIMACYFNLSKTESLLISSKLNKPFHPPIFMQNHQISKVDAHKHIGLYFLMIAPSINT